jgi:hypothetical protein
MRAKRHRDNRQSERQYDLRNQDPFGLQRIPSVQFFDLCPGPFKAAPSLIGLKYKGQQTKGSIAASSPYKAAPVRTSKNPFPGDFPGRIAKLITAGAISALPRFLAPRRMKTAGRPCTEREPRCFIAPLRCCLGEPTPAVVGALSDNKQLSAFTKNQRVTLMFDERLSDLRLFYCETADAGHIFRPISLNRSTIRLNRAKNLPRPRNSSLRTRKSDSLLGEPTTGE